MPVIIIHGGAGRIKNAAAHRRGIKKALQIGWAILNQGGKALDAVCEAVKYMEDSTIFNCGSGATLTLDGTVELDASVMIGQGEYGAVGAIKQVKNPILVARQVMEKTDHLLLVGPGAQKFSRRRGFKKYEKILEVQKRRLARFKKRGNSAYFPKLNNYLKLGTVGAVALDNDNQIAVANSTGGILGKMPGRVGDTPIFGAGVYATKNSGVAATGHGEEIIRLFLAKYVADLTDGLPAQKAVSKGIAMAKEKNVLCGVIGLDRKGNVGYGFTTKSMSWGYIGKAGEMRLF
ncbi:MAG: isoaspartyl peptidase/L-asparaginase [Candidatus Latescibacteria bacterium]|nr:isoaspartyl peptidase/L-asparaginase [Candidatus Latescibacterota bacterium]